MKHVKNCQVLAGFMVVQLHKDSTAAVIKHFKAQGEHHTVMEGP